MRESHCCHPAAFRLGLIYLIPFLSWFLRRGRCGYCGARMTAAIPLLELIMVAAVVSTAVQFQDGKHVAASCLFGWLLIVLVATDLRHQILPDSLTAALLASGLLAALILPAPGFVEALAGAAFGAGSFFLLRFLYFRYRGIEGLGLGDVRLMAGLGAWLGLSWLPLLVIVAATTGLLSVFLQAWKDGVRVSATSAVPFGAYLGGSALLLAYLRAASVWEW